MNKKRFFLLGFLSLLVVPDFQIIAQEKKEELTWALVTIAGELYDRFDVSGTATLNVEPDHPFRFLPDKDGYNSAIFLVLRLGKSLVRITIDRNADPKDYDSKKFEALAKQGIIAEGLLVARKPKEWGRSRIQPDKVSLALYPIRGKVRIFDPDVDGQLVPKGSLYIRGRAIPGNYTLTDGKPAFLAIENGNYPIFLTGNLTEDQANWNGIIAIVGKLDPSFDQREIRIIPEKIELIRE